MADEIVKITRRRFLGIGAAGAAALALPATALLASAAAAVLLVCALWPNAALADSRAVTVSFDANGPAAEIYVTSGLDQVSVPKIELDFEGFEFTGEWNTERDGSGVAYAAGDAVTESMTLYAQWADGSCLDESSSGSDGSDQDDSNADNASSSSGSDSTGAENDSTAANADADDGDENSAASTASTSSNLRSTAQAEQKASSSGSSASSSSSAFAKTGGDVTGIIALASLLGLTAAALLLARRHVKGERE